MKTADPFIRDIKLAEESMASQFTVLLERHSIPLPSAAAFTVLSIGCGSQPIELEVIARQHKQAELIGIDISESDIEDFEENRKGAYSEGIKTMVADASKPDTYKNIDPESVKLVFFRHPVVFHDSYQTLIEIFQLVLAKFHQAQIFVSCQFPHEVAILNYVLQTDPPLPCRVLKTAGTLIVENLTCTSPQDPLSFVFSAATTQINPLHHQRIIDEFNMIKSKVVQLESKLVPAKQKFIKDEYTSLMTLNTKGAPLNISKLIKYSGILAAISTNNEFQRDRLYELSSPFFNKLLKNLLNTYNYEPDLLKPKIVKVLSETDAPEFVLQDRNRRIEKCKPHEILIHFVPIIMLTEPTYKALKLKPLDEYVSFDTINNAKGRPEKVILIRCTSCYMPLKVEGPSPDLRLVANKPKSLSGQEVADLKAVYPNGIFYRNAVGQITFLTEKISTPQEALAKKAKFKAFSFTQKVKVTKHAYENSYYCALFFSSPKKTNEFLQGFKNSNFESAKDKSVIALVQYLDCLKRHLRDCQKDMVKPLLTLITLLRRDSQISANFHVLLLEWACLQQFKNEPELLRLYNDRLSGLSFQDYPEFESLDSLKQAFTAWLYKTDFPDLITEAMLDEFPGINLKTVVNELG